MKPPLAPPPPAPDPVLVAEAEKALETWRRHATSVVLVSLLALASGLALAVFFGPGRDFAPVEPVIFAWLLGTLTVLALWQRGDYRVRAWTAAFAGYVLAGDVLVRAGLVGIGRLTLATIPMVALMLLGLRAALLTFAASVGTLTAFAVFASSGHLAEWLVIRENPVGGAFWFSQVLGFVLVVAPTLVVLVLGDRLLRRTLTSERANAARLEEQIRELSETRDALVREAAERRRLEAAMLEVAERERRAIGFELHDGVCQQLAGALLRCNVAAAQPQAPAAEHVAAVSALLRDALDQAHGLAETLSPGTIEPRRLDVALEDLVRRFARIADARVELKVDAVARLPGLGSAAQLYRIAQEALANAARHAGATSVVVSLQEDAGSLVLRIDDDGAGLPAAPSGGGMGLRSMRYRAESIGARLEVGARPGGGTRVECRLPPGSATPGGGQRKVQVPESTPKPDSAA